MNAKAKAFWALTFALFQSGCCLHTRPQNGASLTGVIAMSPTLENLSADRLATDMISSEDLLDEDLDQGFPPVEQLVVSDPLRPVNRVVHSANDRVYTYLLAPISRMYDTMVPDPVEIGLRNAFDNVRFPQRLVNNLLQGKFQNMGKETGKFVVNSTVGVLGLWRASDRYESLHVSNEDLGQTFGVWGLGNGPYIVLPLLGPATLRDVVGRLGDGLLDPLNYVGATNVRLEVRGAELLNDSKNQLSDYNALKAGSLDTYTSLKDAYVQARHRQVTH